MTDNNVSYMYDDKHIVLTEEGSYYMVTIIYPDNSEFYYQDSSAVQALRLAMIHANTFSSITEEEEEESGRICEVCYKRFYEGYVVESIDYGYYCSQDCLDEQYFLVLDREGGITALYESPDSKASEDIEFYWTTFE